MLDIFKSNNYMCKLTCKGINLEWEKITVLHVQYILYIIILRIDFASFLSVCSLYDLGSIKLVKVLLPFFSDA